jgi:hypothetical protein
VAGLAAGQWPLGDGPIPPQTGAGSVTSSSFDRPRGEFMPTISEDDLRTAEALAALFATASMLNAEPDYQLPIDTCCIHRKQCDSAVSAYREGGANPSKQGEPKRRLKSK